MKRSTFLLILGIVIIIVGIIDLALGVYHVNYYITYTGSAPTTRISAINSALFEFVTGIPIILIGLDLFRRNRNLD